MADAKTAAAAGDSPAVDGKTSTVFVECLRKQRFRAGHAFTRGWNTVDVTQGELGALVDDPHLRVETKKPDDLKDMEAARAAKTKSLVEIREKETAARDKNRKTARATRNAKLDRMAKDAESEAKARDKKK